MIEDSYLDLQLLQILSCCFLVVPRKNIYIYIVLIEILNV